MTGETLIRDGRRALRALAPEDRDRLRAWRNQERVRLASLAQGVIDAEAHAAWFARTLARDDGVWTVYTLDDAPLGHASAVIVDLAAARWRWSFYIGEPAAPRGEGSAMLRLLLALVFGDRGARVIEAIALADNPASLAIHRKLGFEETGPAAPTVSNGLSATGFELTAERWRAGLGKEWRS